MVVFHSSSSSSSSSSSFSFLKGEEGEEEEEEDSVSDTKWSVSGTHRMVRYPSFLRPGRNERKKGNKGISTSMFMSRRVRGISISMGVLPTVQRKKKDHQVTNQVRTYTVLSKYVHKKKEAKKNVW